MRKREKKVQKFCSKVINVWVKECSKLRRRNEIINAALVHVFFLKQLIAVSKLHHIKTLEKNCSALEKDIEPVPDKNNWTIDK